MQTNQGQFDTFLVIVDKASKEEVKLSTDSYLDHVKMVQKHTVHVATIVKSFMDGIVDSHKWSMNTKLPIKIDAVSNWIVFMWQKEHQNFVVESSIKEIVNKTKGWAFDHPEFVKWIGEADLNSLFYNMATNLLYHIHLFENEKKDYIHAAADKSVLPQVQKNGGSFEPNKDKNQKPKN